MTDRNGAMLVEGMDEPIHSVIIRVVQAYSCENRGIICLLNNGSAVRIGKLGYKKTIGSWLNLVTLTISPCERCIKSLSHLAYQIPLTA